MTENRSLKLHHGPSVNLGRFSAPETVSPRTAAVVLTTGELWSARNSLELKLRTSAGVAFQDFFSTVMEKKLGDDFIRVRPYGSLGDRGCDGYQRSNGCVYQCYGELNGETNAVAKLVSKLKEDFATVRDDPELGPLAYFSDRGRPFQADRGRRNKLVVAALGKRAGTELTVAQSSTISLKWPLVMPMSIKI